MAPKSRKARSTGSRTSDAAETAAPSQPVHAKLTSPMKTPTRSPIKCKTVKITAAQKQALIDNLQLEITERARRLRAQYALQAQGLRTRLEIRVHRIPPALRKRTIGEVLREYEERNSTVNSGNQEEKGDDAAKSGHALASPQKMIVEPSKPLSISTMAGHGKKRPSADMDAEANKENNTVMSPRKRVRTAPTPPEKPQPHPYSIRVVLSPRSNNSRTLPQSPFKPLPPTPFKSQIARPISPLKPSITVPTASSLAKTAGATRTAKAKAGGGSARPTSRQGAASVASGTARPKRGAAGNTATVTFAPLSEDENEENGRASSMSDMSAGTTIVTKPYAPLKTATKTGAKKTTRTTQSRTAIASASTTTTASAPLNVPAEAAASTTPETPKKEKGNAKKTTTLAGKIVGMGARAGKKVAGASVAAAAKVEAVAAAAAGNGGDGVGIGGGGSVRGGRVLRKRV